MKNLSEIIKTLSASQIEELKKSLNIKDSSRSLANIILSYSGMAQIVSQLNCDERNILYAAHKEKNGITFAELEKRFKLENEKIEKYTNKLSRILLLSVLKNRQKLNNKMDKIHLISEIRDFLNPIDNNHIFDYFRDINRIIELKDFSGIKGAVNSLPKASVDLLAHIYNEGGMISLKEFENLTPQKQTDKIITDLIQKKYVHVFHELTLSGHTYIALSKKIFAAFAIETPDQAKKNISVHNRYYLLLNLLKTYDTVSTYGLFLTKQKEFRKIDKKHLEDSMIKLSDPDGAEFDAEKISQLCLYLLNVQNSLSIKDDSVIVSLKNIEKYLDDPLEWLLKIIIQLNDFPINDSILKSPFEIPEYKDLIFTINLIFKNNNNTYKFIESAHYINYVAQLSGDQFINTKQIKQNTNKTFHICTQFLCITGIIESENNLIKLSDIGLRIAHKLQIIHTEETNDGVQKDVKNMYLDSNFTIITPKHDISSDALYHILTHTEIIVNDVILHTKISRESILASLKRGMSNEMFFNVLRTHLKTEIPDNLNFLITEWVNQTIRLKIFNAVILYTDQTSFIDKIAHGKIKNSIIKRISADYAIIDRRYMDKIIKIAKENDAVINLFDEAVE
ncbi:MAG: helicase-associated domain-containing protein [Spirochaetota bacterium]